MLRCKEGNLAVILDGPYTGYFVTVGKFMGSIRVQSMVTGTIRQGVNVWLISGPGIPQTHGELPVSTEDHDLQPIRPGGTGITTETKKEITA